MRLPVVEAAFALSADGKVVARGERRRVDAVLAGRRAFEAGGAFAGAARGTVRAIFSNSGKLRASPETLWAQGAPFVVFTTEAMPARTRARLSEAADVRFEPRRRSLDLRRALAILAADYGVRLALCEGGPALLRGLVQAGLLARLHVTFLPLVLGGAHAPTLLGPAGEGVLARSVQLRLKSCQTRGGLVRATYRLPRGCRRAIKAAS